MSKTHNNKGKSTLLMFSVRCISAISLSIVHQQLYLTLSSVINYKSNNEIKLFIGYLTLNVNTHSNIIKCFEQVTDTLTLVFLLRI